jgi:hypothetical protein
VLLFEYLNRMAVLDAGRVAFFYRTRKPCRINRQALLSGAANITTPTIMSGTANMKPTTGRTTKPIMNKRMETARNTRPIVRLEKRSCLHSLASMMFSYVWFF